jgi:hypothetical protein
MEHEGAVLTGAGGGGLTHLLHLVVASLSSSQLSPAPLSAWIGSVQRGRSREQQVLDQRSKDIPPTVRARSREQHGLGSCGQGETKRSRKSRTWEPTEDWRREAASSRAVLRMEAASRAERSRARVRGRWGREGDSPAHAWEVGKGRGALMG